MNNYLRELNQQSENGDKLSQIKLFYKLYYDYDNIQQAGSICNRWRNHNLFLEGLWNFYGFLEFNNKFYLENDPTRISVSSIIFGEIIAKTPVNEITYYAYNMMGLCTDSNFRHEYFELAAKHGIEYAHINLACRHIDSMYHYESAASKYNRRALLQLAYIYITDYTRRNIPLAIKYFQTAIDCEYDLIVHMVWLLKDYDVHATIYFLKYEANKNNNEAILRLGELYSTNSEVLNQKLAMDLYLQAREICKYHSDNICKIVMAGKFEWSQKYHRLWPLLYFKINQNFYCDGKLKSLPLTETSFQQQVVILLLITKYRYLSYFNFTKLLYKNIVLSIITQLSKVWINHFLPD